MMKITGGIDSVSIHAPREGRDIKVFDNRSILRLFQSTRPVRGATLAKRNPNRTISVFQSTRPVRGATRPSTVARHR